MAEAGEGPEVALQATYGYYWAADLLKENGPTSTWCTLWGSIMQRLCHQPQTTSPQPFGVQEPLGLGSLHDRRRRSPTGT